MLDLEGRCGGSASLRRICGGGGGVGGGVGGCVGGCVLNTNISTFRRISFKNSE